MPGRISGEGPSRIPPTQQQKAVAKEAKGIGNWFKKQLAKLSGWMEKWTKGKSDTCARMRQQTITPVRPASVSVKGAQHKAMERGKKLGAVEKQSEEMDTHAAEFADLARQVNQKFTQQANTGCFARIGKFLFG